MFSESGHLAVSTILNSVVEEGFLPKLNRLVLPLGIYYFFEI